MAVRRIREHVASHNWFAVFVDLVIVDADLLVATRRNQAGLAVVAGVDADCRAPDRGHAGNALHLLGDHLALVEQLVAAQLVDLQKAFALEAGCRCCPDSRA